MYNVMLAKICIPLCSEQWAICSERKYYVHRDRFLCVTQHRTHKMDI